MTEINTESYNDIVENGEWLEDCGNCSRYATEDEESVWVCNICEVIVDDPYEHDCEDDGDEIDF